MQESRGKRVENKEELEERLSEATNDKTLSEIERNQNISDKTKTSEREVPAPDAEPREPRKERDDAGPM